MRVRKMEIVRLFVTPDDLTRLSKRVQDAYDEREIGHSTIVESIVNDSERVIIEIGDGRRYRMRYIEISSCFSCPYLEVVHVGEKHALDGKIVRHLSRCGFTDKVFDKDDMRIYEYNMVHPMCQLPELLEGDDK